MAYTLIAKCLKLSHNTQTHTDTHTLCTIYSTTLHNSHLCLRLRLWYVHALLDHALGHHAHCVLQRLPLVAEPNADHFALVAKLVGQAGDFGSCPRKEVN